MYLNQVSEAPRRHAPRRWGLLGLFGALAVTAAFAAPADLDPTFSTDGKVTTSFAGRSETGLTLAVQADGKILQGVRASLGSGDVFALARFNPDGTLDAGFGAGGKVATIFGIEGDDDEGTSLAVQADGKILLAGSTVNVDVNENYDFALAR